MAPPPFSTHPPAPIEGQGKRLLRNRASEVRALACAASPAAGEALVDTFPLHLLAQSAVVAGYWPFRTEIDPRPLMAALAARGATLALPVTPPRGADAGLAFRLFDAATPLSPGPFGVHEPPAHAPLVEPDLILVPLLAFDGFGRRLGYGAGHYDRTLPALCGRGAIALGVAFAAQEVSRVPAEPHDVALHGIVTERAYIGAMSTPA